MSKDDSKKGKSSNEQANRKSPTKTKGRSFCCSMFIYTFVFVSGVVIATILPDLIGHHLQQPYGKEYGVMLEKTFKDVPKYLKTVRETATVIGHGLFDRMWILKTELERRIGDMSNKKDDTKKMKTATPRSTRKTEDEDRAHKVRTHDATQTASKQTITITSTLEWVNPMSFDIDDRSSSNKDL